MGVCGVVGIEEKELVSVEILYSFRNASKLSGTEVLSTNGCSTVVVCECCVLLCMVLVSG